MTTQRIDISFRVVEGVNDSFTVNYNSLGDKVCTVAAGLYMNHRDLASAVQDAIDAQWSASASFEVFNAISTGIYSIESTALSFSLTWDAITLRDALGFSGDLSGAASYTGDLPPGVLISSMPWVEDRHGWTWSTRGISHRHRRQAVKVNRRDLWSVRVFEKRDNLAQFRSVVSKLMLGIPATWYRDTGTITAWSYSNWSGKVEVCIDPRRVQYSEQFENPNNVQDVLSARLEMVAI